MNRRRSPPPRQRLAAGCLLRGTDRRQAGKQQLEHRDGDDELRSATSVSNARPSIWLAKAASPRAASKDRRPECPTAPGPPAAARTRQQAKRQRERRGDIGEHANPSGPASPPRGFSNDVCDELKAPDGNAPRAIPCTSMFVSPTDPRASAACRADRFRWWSHAKPGCASNPLCLPSAAAGP